MNVGREEEVENSLRSDLSSLRILVALYASVRFPELSCGYGTFKS